MAGAGATLTAPSPDLIARLAAAGCVAAEAEAAELVRAAPDDRTLESWVTRREHGEPLPWIVGTVEFCGRRLHIEPGVYVPRPQTEELARRAATLLPERGRAVDLCTGCGAVAARLSAAVPSATVVGVDRDQRAVACARRNGVAAVQADLASALRPGGWADVVTAVAPYVPTHALALLPADVQRHEARRALDGGPDGLDLVRGVVAAAAALLRDGGHLLLELGADQDRLLARDLASARLEVTARWTDEHGDLRGVACRSGGGLARHRSL